MRKSRAFGLAAVSIGLATAVLLSLSLHTLLLSLTSAVSDPEAFRLQRVVDIDAGEVIFTLAGRLRNTGMLGASLKGTIRLLSAEKAVVAEAANATGLPPGALSELTLSLRIPMAELERYQLTETLFELCLDVRTLLDLVGISASVTIQVGGGFS
jgi:hypothetical protein